LKKGKEEKRKKGKEEKMEKQGKSLKTVRGLGQVEPLCLVGLFGLVELLSQAGHLVFASVFAFAP
jgi:hypothetical protein